ncbi:unnamed protein product [Brugia pahangi]|uniref:H/ACA ribonucleoprotein complex subunit n=1 Tax=Brugia pahangi TaxID=6280 RepID=A0A0N4TMH5_BRUPA|nr:unnamed protein product [Brugia pahangi]
MSSRGRSGGSSRGFRNFGHGGRRGSRGGSNRSSGYDQGPPEQVTEIGYFTHTCEDDIVCHNTSGKIPYFNAAIFFENKEQIGKVDEIFGGIKDNGFTVKLQDGIKASSFKEAQKLFIDSGRLLPIERFLPNSANKRGKGQVRGTGRGGRGRGGSDRSRFRGKRGGSLIRNGGSDRGNGGDRGGFRGGSRGSFRGGGEWNGRGNGFRERGLLNHSVLGRGVDFGHKRSFGGHSETIRNKRMKHIFDCFNKVRICHCIGLFPVQQHYQLLRCKIVPFVECFALYSKLKIASVKLFDTLYNVILPLCFIKRSFKKTLHIV